MRFAIEQPTSAGELISLWTRSFEEPAEVFSGVWNGCAPEDRIALCARNDLGELVGNVMVYMLPVNGLGGEILRAGGVANVSTLPTHRGKGISGGLLGLLDEALSKSDADFSLLYTGIPAHYARYGFVAIDEPQWLIEQPSGTSVTYEMSYLPELLMNHQPLALRRSAKWISEVIQPRLKGKIALSSANGYLIAEAGQSVTIIEAGGDWEPLTHYFPEPVLSHVRPTTLPFKTQAPRTGAMVRPVKMSSEHITQLFESHSFRLLDHF